MPFDAFQNNVWTIARSSTENFSPYRPIPPGEEKMVVTFLRPLLCSTAGMARYDFGENRVATVTLLTITTLPGRRSCGTAMAKFSGHAVTFRRWPWWSRRWGLRLWGLSHLKC